MASTFYSFFFFSYMQYNIIISIIITKTIIIILNIIANIFVINIVNYIDYFLVSSVAIFCLDKFRNKEQGDLETSTFSSFLIYVTSYY